MGSRCSTDPRLRPTLACPPPFFFFCPVNVFPSTVSLSFTMNRLTTRTNNKDKHPGIVDLSPQRRTHTQKKADDEKAAEDKEAREGAHRAGVRQLAEVERRAMQKLKALMTPGTRPRASGQTSATADSLGVDMGEYTYMGKTHRLTVMGNAQNQEPDRMVHTQRRRR
jgi:hypothetical protein